MKFLKILVEFLHMELTKTVNAVILTYSMKEEPEVRKWN